MKAEIEHVRYRLEIEQAPANNIPGIIAPLTYALTVEAPIGGIIETTPAPGNHASGSLVVIKAIPNVNYTFVRWLINGVQLLGSLSYIYLTESKNIVAEFISGILLTITKSGLGTITPDVGVYPKSLNEDVEISLSGENSDWYAEGFMVDGIEVFDNPLTVTMNAAKGVQGVAKPWVKQMQIFDEKPVKRGNTWFFGSKWRDLDSEIKNIRVGGFFGGYVNSNISINGKSPVNFTIEYTNQNTTTNKAIVVCHTIASAQKGFSLYSNSSNLIFIIGNGTTSQSCTMPGIWLINNKYIINVTWNGLIEGKITITVNDNVYNFTATHEWVGMSTTAVFIGNSLSIQTLNGIVPYCEFVGYFKYVFNHCQGSTIFDISGNGNNGTVTGANLATFWGSTANEIEPYDLTLGATLYQNNSDLMNSLIGDGTFSTGVSGWMPQDGNTIVSWENNSLKNTFNAGSTYSYKAFPTEIGRMYYFKGTLVSSSNITSGYTAIRDNGTGGGNPIANGQTVTNGQTSYGSFVATTTLSSIRVQHNGVVPQAIAYWDNIQVSETDVYDDSIMPICYNKPEAIIGYTRLGWFPAGSGILKGLPNTYNIPIDNILNRLIPAGDYTEAQIRALVASERLIKTEGLNNISLLKVIEKFIELRDSNNLLLSDSLGNIINAINTR